MDLERFQEMLDSPSMSREELLTIRANVLRKDEVQHLLAVEQVLSQRFPAWRKEPSGHGGERPTAVSFRGEHREFPSQKQAYIWLVERFIANNPKPFVDLDWETVYIVKGPRILYFAKSLRALFKHNPRLADDKRKHHRLTNGWYAQLYLSENQKLEILERLSAVAQLKMGVEWDWNGRGQAPGRLDADELLRELGEPRPS